MNWNQTLPLLATMLVALIGWFVVHWLNTCRDQANKRRELRVQHLLTAYIDAPILPLLEDLRRELKLPKTEQTLQWFSASKKQDK